MKKLAEKRLQETHLKLLRSQGGRSNEQERQKAIIKRAEDIEEALKKIFTPKQVST